MQPKPQAVFEEEPLAVMRIAGAGDVPLRAIADFADAVDRIHRRIQAMDTLFILLKQGYDIPGTRSRSDQIGVIVQRSEEQLILPKLAAVELHSPGFWEILGSLSPLKFISDCLQFWHERSKDKEYRNTSEAARLWLENEQKKNEVFRQRIDLMKSVGISDDELRRQFFEPIAASVSVLYDLSKSGVVTPNSASITVHSKDGENNV